MRVEKRPGGETVVILSTDANRSLGAFLVFVGVVATPPAWYLYSSWFGHVPQTWKDCYPAFVLGALLVIVGYLLAVHSRKRVWITPTAVHLWEGTLRRPLTFRWSAPPQVRVQRIDSQSPDHPMTRWVVKLVSERHEYTLDERLDQQLQSRTLAETVAKTLGCPVVEQQEDASTLTIAASDLDLPFCERVRKYPNLLGSPVPKPEPCAIHLDGSNGSLRYSWGVGTAGLLVDIAGAGLAFALLSAVPTRPEQPSLLERAIISHDFSLYYYLLGAVAGFAALVSGFRVQLTLSPREVNLQESMWGVPFRRRSIPTGHIEEVQIHRSVRGPLVQVISDEAIIQFRVSELAGARWMGHEIRRFLMDSGPCEAAAGSGSPA